MRPLPHLCSSSSRPRNSKNSNLDPNSFTTKATIQLTMSHSHDGSSHSHDGANGFSAQEHGHSHEILDGPGSYLGREMPIVEGRDWSDRAFTVGIGG